VKDILALAALTLSLATLVTVHVSIAGRLLLGARPRWRGPAALVVPPLAPLWAFGEGWRKLGLLWVGAALIYLVGRLAAAV
jgi:hypothetical protein